MPMALFFWMLMVLWFVFGVAGPYWIGGRARPALVAAVGDVLVFLCVFCLGWAVFGAPIK